MKIYQLFLIGLLMCSIYSCSDQSTLSWHQKENHRWAAVETDYFGSPGFELLDPSETNISFESFLTEEEIKENRNFLNGSGVAAGDIDGDGLVDLYFGQLNGPNKLYKNTGNFTFRDITKKAGVSHDGYYTTGTVFADVDGDGDLDLLVASLTKENVLYLNDGSGIFTRKENSGLTQGNGSTSMALADVDQDGDLDLYITNYKEKEANDLFDLSELTWENMVKEGFDRSVTEYTLLPPYDQHFEIIYRQHMPPDQREVGSRDQFYLNNGDGSFTKVTDLENHFLTSSGEPMELNRGWGLTAKFHDLNGDMLPDLYVCNDFWTPDRVWINQGDGTFREIDELAIRNYSFSSMAVDFSDINRDGIWDFFVTEMLSSEHTRRTRQRISYDPREENIGDIANKPQYMRNSLYLGRQDHTFAEITYFSNTEATEWSWATRFLDVDLDGYEDLIINTGHAYDVQDLDTQESMNQQSMRSGPMEGTILQYPTLRLTNKALKNNGDLTFTEQSSKWGFDEKDISHGLASADYDRDGDLDLVLSRLNQAPAVYRNSSNAPRIGVRLIGTKPNTQAIGSKVKLTGGPVMQQEQVASGGEYLSSSDTFMTFAAEPENPNHQLEVRWPDGSSTKIDSVGPNQIYEIKQPTKTDPIPHQQADSAANPIFEDFSERIAHRHHETYYNDFGIQALLPVKLSQQGPGVSWIDYDSDGDDDLFVSSGRDGQMGLYQNDGQGHFTEITDSLLFDEAVGDQTTILGLGTDNGTHLIVGSANYEQGYANAPSGYQYLYEEKKIIEEKELPSILSTTGPLASADYDGDGDLDLFVGGRFNPARYPQDANSRLFKNENGSFVLDRTNSNKFRQVGLITGAVFTDIDKDGDQDLLCSREWDSILLFKNNSGNLQNVSSEVGLEQFNGWWNGITTGDFNNDGLPDIVATNWGRNSYYQLDSGKPLRMYYEDFDRDGRLEILEAYYNEDQQAYMPRKQLYSLRDPIGNVKMNIQSHEEFSRSTVDELIGQNLEQSRVPYKTINTLASTLFLNTGSGFEAHPLPKEAQFSIAYAVATADVNNDGNEDLFLSQNFFATPKLVPRQDAGRGLWLKGDGKGHFDVLSGSQSGIKIYGEQRGAALSDFDHDGKTDLAVSQNGAPTKLFRNQTEKRGITIQLRGDDSNTLAIGSGVRLVYADGSKGPLREIQAGSGYWSQNSAIQVLGYQQNVEAIEVQWYDGSTRQIPFVSGKMNYQIVLKK